MIAENRGHERNQRRHCAGNDEPPSKRQRADTEEKPPVASRPPNPASFPADTLFRCQRVVELLLRHPHITYFNQALGQPNITTIDVSSGTISVQLPAPSEFRTRFTLFCTFYDSVIPPDRCSCKSTQAGGFDGRLASAVQCRLSYEILDSADDFPRCTCAHHNTWKFPDQRHSLQEGTVFHPELHFLGN